MPASILIEHGRLLSSDSDLIGGHPFSAGSTTMQHLPDATSSRLTDKLCRIRVVGCSAVLGELTSTCIHLVDRPILQLPKTLSASGNGQMVRMVG